MRFVITKHAKFEADRRNISEALIKSTIEKAQQKIPSKKERIIFQQKYYDKIEGKEMLLRVIGKEAAGKFVVITAYKTSKIEKYWLKESENEGDI
jgi:response regulator of citrate/malate metabolism